MASELRIYGIVDESIVDGPGLRLVVFTQGCLRHCPGCHNPESQSLDGGRIICTDEVLQMYVQDPLLAGITFSGGEPFLQPAPLCEIAGEVKRLGGTVMTYTGYTLEELLDMTLTMPEVKKLLDESDILVDGPFIAAERDLDLLFRGSRNQRLLDREAISSLTRQWEERRRKSGT